VTHLNHFVFSLVKKKKKKGTFFPWLHLKQRNMDISSQTTVRFCVQLSPCHISTLAACWDFAMPSASYPILILPLFHLPFSPSTHVHSQTSGCWANGYWLEMRNDLHSISVNGQYSTLTHVIFCRNVTFGRNTERDRADNLSHSCLQQCVPDFTFLGLPSL